MTPSLLARWREIAGARLASMAPGRARSRQFALLEHPTRKDIEHKRVDPEMLLLHLFLDPRKAFFDVGSNAGDYAYMALKHIPASQVFAFEPQEILARRLRALLPGVQVERVALSAGSGSACLRIPRSAGKLYRARGTLESSADGANADALYERVPTRALDEIRSPFPVGCIKIDVEGHELAVLRGAEETLAKDAPVLIIEIEQRHHQEPIDTIFAWLKRHGYHSYFFDPSANRFVDSASFSIGTHQNPAYLKTVRYINNFICIPDGMAMPEGSINLLHEHD